MKIPEDVNPTLSSKVVERLILIIVLILIMIVIIPIWFFFVSGMYIPFEKSEEYLAQHCYSLNEKLMCRYDK